MKIDVFPHILPRKYFDRLLAVAPPGLALQKRMSGIPVLVDLDLRFTMMDRWDGYVQVLTLANPPIEVVAPPAASPDLARIANDEMAAIVERHPHRFPGFVASLPMNNPDAALAELDRAIDDLGATGVQIFTNVNGRPLDRPEYQPVFARMAERRLPIWLHPARPATAADYAEHRLALGIADTAEIGGEVCYPLEANFEMLHGVDFKKGCYIGQELTARMKLKGELRKRILPVSGSAPLPRAGTPVTADGAELGPLIAASGTRGLALLRLDRLADANEDSIRAQDVQVSIHWPSWLQR